MKKIVFKIREKWANKRFDFFLEKIKPFPGMSILDLGGYDGTYMDRFKDKLSGYKVIIADLDKTALERASAKGYHTLLLDGSLDFPFKDNEFDVIFCNSVIEHVTIPKDEIWNEKNNSIFFLKSIETQKKFASEIIRCSKKYFVQTPHKYFPIESHSWFPFVIVFLPRNLQIVLMKILNKFWIKRTSPDWNLLTYKEMKLFFPDAEVIVNKKLGFPKEIIVIKK